MLQFDLAGFLISLSKVDFEEFPLQFISTEDAGFIYNKEAKKIHLNRFEYECYRKIADAIDHSTIFVTDRYALWKSKR